MLEDHPAWAELRLLVQKLSLISHTSGVSYDGKVARDTSESIGGRRPPGSDREFPDRHDMEEMSSFLSSHHRRTVEYFVREMERCRSASRLSTLCVEAAETLKAWQRAPLPQGQEPEYGSPQWKRFIAESSEDGGSLARRFNVTRQYISLIRKQYREVST